jgi:hypothetical protein
VAPKLDCLDSCEAVAFVAVRYKSRVVADASLRNMAIILLGISFALVAFVSLLGVFVNLAQNGQ